MMGQMCPAALGRHTLEDDEEEKPIEGNCCALTNNPMHTPVLYEETKCYLL